MLLAPVVRDQKGEFRDVVERWRAKGSCARAIDGADSSNWPANVRVKLDPKDKHTHRSGRGPAGDR